MRTFFLQIFLSFWLATILIFIGVTAFVPDDVLHKPDELASAARTNALHALQLSLADYRLHGCTSSAFTQTDWTVIDKNGKPLCGRPLQPVEAAMIQVAAKRGVIVGRNEGARWIHVLPVTDDTGERWFVLFWSPTGRVSWLPQFPRSALPVSIVVTFFFAYLLTRPLRELSRAFRKFTAGDLDARLPVAQTSRWGQFDSADVRTLMADFNTMADRVTELIDAQKMLVRDVSHELRSPLARLRLAVELAREESTSSAAIFDQMEQETEKLNALIGELLTLSLMESTRQVPRPDHLDIRSLVEDVIEDARFEARARGCEINFRDTETIRFIRGRSEMLARAFENILRNAIRYTPPGGLIEVEISDLEASQAALVQMPGEGLRISVRDNGPGIPVDHLSHIFRPFYRVDMARSESSGGFGVGLAIAERAVHLHGGKILASNRDEGGLDVQIFLPLETTQESS